MWFLKKWVVRKDLFDHERVNVESESITCTGIRNQNKNPTGDAASRDVSGLLDFLRAEVEAKQRECVALIAQIETASSLVRRCHGCEKPPTPESCRACPTLPSLQQARLMRLVLERL